MDNYRTWCEIDLNAIRHNFMQYRNITGNGVKIAAVVKADAYGHGDEACARMLSECGADYFAVAFVGEAVRLRKEGITEPILILGYTAPSRACDVVKYGITAAVYDYGCAEALSREAAAQNKTVKIHIKADTGMGRIGYIGEPEKIAGEIAKIKQLPGIDVEGIFTHFAKADELPGDYTEKQYKKFCEIINACEKSGITFKIRHCCNSAAAVLYPKMHMDMVRVGIGLYGCYPSDLEYGVDLRPAMTFKTRVINVKTVKKGESISYGGIYTAPSDTKIATIAVGYADGLPRILSDKARVLVNGSFAKITGRICMDQCMIDVSCVNNINVGDEAVIFGTGDGVSLPVEEPAALAGTISYELLCGIGARVPRIYPGFEKSL